MQYIIDKSKLQAFDIILTREETKRSKAIRGISFGDYSHALICLNSSSLIEATIEGRVFTENVQRLIFDKADDCKVLRFKSILTKEQQEKMNFFLRDQIGVRYSIKEAIQIPFFSMTKKTTEDSGQFCSRLVAQAYQSVDINLVTNPNYCTPENLNSSEYLHDIPDVIRIATSEDIEIYERPSQIKENQIQTYIWLDKVAELAKKENFKIYKQNDVGMFLLEHPSYDDEVCSYVRNTNYLENYKQDEIVHPFRYVCDSRGMVNIAEEFDTNLSELKRHATNYLVCKKNYESTKFSYCSMLKDLSENLIKQCSQRLEVLKEYIKIDFALSEDTDHKNYLSNILIEINYLQVGVKNILRE
jgi:hypothetical protein